MPNCPVAATQPSMNGMAPGMAPTNTDKGVIGLSACVQKDGDGSEKGSSLIDVIQNDNTKHGQHDSDGHCRVHRHPAGWHGSVHGSFHQCVRGPFNDLIERVGSPYHAIAANSEEKYGLEVDQVSRKEISGNGREHNAQGETELGQLFEIIQHAMP